MTFEQWRAFVLAFTASNPRIHTCLKYLVIPKLMDEKDAFIPANLLDQYDYAQLLPLFSLTSQFRCDKHNEYIVIHVIKPPSFSITWDGNLAQFSKDLCNELSNSACTYSSTTKHAVRTLMRGLITSDSDNTVSIDGALYICEECADNHTNNNVYLVPTEEFARVCDELDSWTKQLENLSQLWPSNVQMPTFCVKASFKKDHQLTLHIDVCMK